MFTVYSQGRHEEGGEGGEKEGRTEREWEGGTEVEGQGQREGEGERERDPARVTRGRSSCEAFLPQRTSDSCSGGLVMTPSKVGPSSSQKK